MRLFHDWYVAILVNADGVEVDRLRWSGGGGVQGAVERLERVGQSRLTPEATQLLERFPESAVEAVGEGPLPEPTQEDLGFLDQAAIRLAERGVADAAGDLDRRLEHLHRAMEEVRVASNVRVSRLVEWLGLFLPDLDLDRDRMGTARALGEADDLGGLARHLGLQTPVHLPARSEWRSLRDHGAAAVEVQGRLDRLEAALHTLAETHLPSLSTLIGPMLAARLCVGAGGRDRLAKLPSSTVQVLGAEKAFFAHLRTGSPPPKHGFLFAHPWVMRSPQWVRGKVARTLAGRCSIAARLDAYEGTPLTAEAVAEFDAKVLAIRAAHPRPPARTGGR
ncbi:MAG TPA: hypothetical protein HA286_00645 [Candidatus Poseidoniaceae archaeon]|nr:MAG TPA: hypothetical protein D7H96_00630 [Candidatus Poseidoniales archaeon]HIH52762.1 hypothetical protein [Candidatus Poseidoniaceae archaeon]